jgi:hydrogenase maturation protease
LNKDKLLVIGLGNLLMGDDGAGIHIVHELQRRRLPDHVDLIDGGTTGVGLVDILSSSRTVIVIDAIMTNGSSITGIRLFSPDAFIFNKEDNGYSLHDVELTSVLRLMRALDLEIPEIKIVGIPAVDISPRIGLSDECGRLIPEAVELIVK